MNLRPARVSRLNLRPNAWARIRSVINAVASSIEKGESLVDTGKTLQALGADCIVMRHPSSGAPNVLARNLKIPIINAGDGMHEHPSQGLLDAYTMLRHHKKLKGLKVAMIGDIQHSRVARSNIQLLSKFGANVVLCGPPEFLPDLAGTISPCVSISRRLEEAVQDAHVVMMLRVQKERLVGLDIDIERYIAHWQLTTVLLEAGPARRHPDASRPHDSGHGNSKRSRRFSAICNRRTSAERRVCSHGAAGSLYWGGLRFSSFLFRAKRGIPLAEMAWGGALLPMSECLVPNVLSLW